MKASKTFSTAAVVASAIAFACLVQSLRSGQHWLVITGLIFGTLAIVLVIRAVARQQE